MLAAPFTVFSVVLGGAALAAGPGWRSLLVQMLFVHAASCSGDCLTLLRIATQVPPGAFVHNSGWQTYWKGRASG